MVATLLPEVFGSVVDLVVGLAGMSRRKRKAKFEVLKQVFDLLTEINSHYLSLFDAARHACPTSDGKGAWTYRRGGRTVTLKTERGVEEVVRDLVEV